MFYLIPFWFVFLLLIDVSEEREREGEKRDGVEAETVWRPKFSIIEMNEAPFICFSCSFSG